jgi:malonate decarboxylase epsilon subunit
MNIAFLFPGQGAQTPGFLQRLPSHPAVAATFDEASAVLGCDVRALDTEAALVSTVAVQLGGLIAGVAAARTLRAEGVHADAVAGLSSGAYTAAVVCGALDFAAALRLLRLRAQLMERAYPHGFGLAALIGLDESRVARLVAALHTDAQPLYIANVNARTQIVVAGSDQALEAVIQAARQAGAGRAQRMAVGVPSHCPLMEDIAAALRQEIAHCKLAAPEIPFIGNVRARALRDPNDIGLDLANNVVHTVRWHDAMTVLYELGARYFFEAPPGAVLTGLMHESFPDVEARSLTDTPVETIVYLARRVRQNN